MADDMVLGDRSDYTFPCQIFSLAGRDDTQDANHILSIIIIFFNLGSLLLFMLSHSIDAEF